MRWPKFRSSPGSLEALRKELQHTVRHARKHPGKGFRRGGTKTSIAATPFTASLQAGCRHEGPRTHAEIEQERIIQRNEYGRLNDQPTRFCGSTPPRQQQPWD